MEPLPTVDRYIVEGEIGRGGFGAVYRARHAVLDRKVALKVLHPQRQGAGTVLQRFLREAKAVAQLGSPYIVQVLDADMTPDGRAFIAMELLEGEDLAARLERSGRMPTHGVVRLGREVLQGLAVAHAQGIVHRDLKPGNIFLARNANGTEIAKILDFGISKVRTEDPGEELTRTGTMLGTPHYMAPEQFKASRSVDQRADLYSLGTVLYEALSGRLPYDATTLEQLIAAKLSDQPRALGAIAPDVPRAISDVVMRALADAPNDRYQNAAEMDAALARVESTTSAPGVVFESNHGARRAMPTPMLGGGAIGTPQPILVPRRSRLVPIVLGTLGALMVSGLAMLVLAGVGVYFAGQQIDVWLHQEGAPGASSQPIAREPLLPTPSAPPPPLPSTLPPTTPIPDVTGVRITVTAMGAADQRSLDAAVQRALPALARCRGRAPFRTQLTMNVMTGGRLFDGQRITAEPSATRDCVVDAIVSAGPVDPAPGLARFTVTLDAI